MAVERAGVGWGKREGGEEGRNRQSQRGLPPSLPFSVMIDAATEEKRRQCTRETSASDPDSLRKLTRLVKVVPHRPVHELHVIVVP